MSEATKIVDTEQQPANSTPEANGGQGGEKMFTQEELNRIVSDRLAKERTKLENPTEREKALAARETLLTCKERLLEQNAPAVFLDVLDTSDPDKFMAAVEKLRDAGAWGQKPMKDGLSHQNAHAVGGGMDGQISDAFKPKRR